MRFGIAGNIEKPEIGQIVDALVTRFRREHIPFVVHDRLAARVRGSLGWLKTARVRTVPERRLAESCDILISIGGDGTILRMTRLVSRHGTPILGVNLGKLGFLAEVSRDELDGVLDEILRGEFEVEERIMLEAVAAGSRKKSYALNDIVMDLNVSSRIVQVDTWVNGEFLATFNGNGMIVSTPTGSTGYALSNGGPIVTPTNRVLLVSPICPPTLTARPVVVSDDSTVTLTVKQASARVNVAADGETQHVCKAPLTVSVRRAPFTAKLVKRRNVSYYDVLRRKLHWGKDVRTSGTEG